MPDAPGSMRYWKTLLHDHEEDGVSPEVFVAAAASMPDGDLLSVFAHEPGILDRSFRRGVALCAAGDVFFTALLFWRGRIFGVYRHRIAARGVEGIVHDLKEFRLGWLPDEIVKASGGDGSAFALLPPEAEGFPVTCFAGPGSRLFEGYGKIYGVLHDAVAEETDSL